MKYLILPLVLFVVGCTENTTQLTPSVRNQTIEELRDKVTSLEAKLEICQNKLDYAPQYQPPPEPQKPAEPEYETVNAYHITTKLGSTVCYERNNATGDQSSEDLACGMTFSDCKDGYIYRCMVDVKYKIVEERKLVQEE